MERAEEAPKVEPPPTPKTVTAPKKAVEVRAVKAAEVTPKCHVRNMRSIKTIYDKKGVSSLSKEAIAYYNECIESGFKF